MKFAGFAYDQERGELRFEGRRVPLQEQPLRILGLLLEQPGEIVSRERIQAKLWDQKHGDHEHGINTAVRKLRRVLEREEASGLSIVTSAGRGYRLLLPGTDWKRVVAPELASSTKTSALDPAVQEPTGQDAYLTGRFLFSQRNPKALLSAKAHFELACERNPNFAPAHACLSRTCRFLTIFESSDPSLLWQKAEHHALCAVGLDRCLPEAHAAVACVLARYRWRWLEGCAAYEEALRLNPNDAETCCDYGVTLLAMDRYEDGARCLDRVLVIDPRYAVGRATVALGWMMQGRRKEAVAMLTEMTEAMPDFLTPWIYLGIEQLNTAQWQEAEATFLRTLALAPETPMFLSLLGQAYAGQGQGERAIEIAARLTALAGMRYVSPTSLAIAFTAAGSAASALRAVERVVSERDANFALYRKLRALDPIRQSPEFLMTLKAMNLREA